MQAVHDGHGADGGRLGSHPARTFVGNVRRGKFFTVKRQRRQAAEASSGRGVKRQRRQAAEASSGRGSVQACVIRILAGKLVGHEKTFPPSGFAKAMIVRGDDMRLSFSSL